MPPTCTVSVTAVVRNDGSVAVTRVPVEAAVEAVSGGPPFPVKKQVTLAPSASVAITLPAMPVYPGTTYDLAVTLSPRRTRPAPTAEEVRPIAVAPFGPGGGEVALCPCPSRGTVGSEEKPTSRRSRRDRCPRPSRSLTTGPGTRIEIPILHDGVSATEWSKLLPGIWFYDPGFMATAACESAITYLDGEAGILRYRGLPDRAAGRGLHLPRGGLPAPVTATSRARQQFDAWKSEITYHTFIHENVRKRFLEGFHYDAHPMGMLVSAVAALSTFYLDAKGIFDIESRQKQIIRLIAKMPTLAAAAHRFSVGMPFVYPDNSLDFTSNFLSMMWKVAEPRFEANPVLSHALDVLFILHADHEQNCSTTAMRVVGSSHADPYSATAAAAAALYGPLHGGANEQVIKMLMEIGNVDNVPDFIKEIKGGERTDLGLRAPRVQELRPAGQDHQAHRRRGVRGDRAEPAARHRAQARGDRPQRRVLPVAPAVPERRLL